MQGKVVPDLTKSMFARYATVGNVAKGVAALATAFAAWKAYQAVEHGKKLVHEAVGKPLIEDDVAKMRNRITEIEKEMVATRTEIKKLPTRFQLPLLQNPSFDAKQNPYLSS